MRLRNKKPKVLRPARLIVSPWLEKLGIKPQSLAVFEAWDRLLGAEASKARAVGMKQSVLFVDVDSSARMHDLTLRKPGLLRKLQGFFGPGTHDPFATEKAVSDIIFRISDEKR